jgi:hypothetical protein
LDFSYLIFMYRSPPNLRSGTKGKAVPLSSSDKRGLQRSLSASSAISPPAKSTMANVNNEIDPAIVKSAVESHLSSEGVLSEIIARLSVEIKTIVEEAIKAAVKPLSDEVSRLQNEVIDLRTKLRELDNNIADRTDDLEQYQRRNNLRIFGIKETSAEDTDALVLQLCSEKLGIDLPTDAICRSHRVGKQPPPATDGNKRHRPIIVKFVAYRYRQQIFAAKKKLKGSGVTVREDLTARRMEVYRAAAAKHGLRNTWTLDGRVLWMDSRGKKGVATRMMDLEL